MGPASKKRKVALLSKPPLKDVQENVKNMRPCPNCTRTPGLSDNNSNQMGPGPNGRHPRGRFRGYPRSTMPVCDFCKGLKVVFLNNICECGWPAVRWDEKEGVWSCGSQICVKSAVWRRQHPVYTAPVSDADAWYGRGGMGG